MSDISRLLQQFKSNSATKNNIESLLQIYLDSGTETDNIAISLNTNRNIRTATGAQLDGLGAIVGESRNGASDENYRQRILVRVRINRSSGTAAEIISILTDYVKASGITPPTLQLIDIYPAQIYINLIGIVTEPNIFALIASQLIAAGVQGILNYSADDANAFKFSTTSSVEISSVHGYGDVAMTTGGRYSGLLLI